MRVRKRMTSSKSGRSYSREEDQTINSENQDNAGFYLDQELQDGGSGSGVLSSPPLNKVIIQEEHDSNEDQQEEEGEEDVGVQHNEDGLKIVLVEEQKEKIIQQKRSPFSAKSKSYESLGSPNRRNKDNNIVGTWQGATAGEIEGYLLGAQRKFIKYKLNVFFLNKCVLRIQHFYFNKRRERLVRQAKQAFAQNNPYGSMGGNIFSKSNPLSTIQSASCFGSPREKSDNQIVLATFQNNISASTQRTMQKQEVSSLRQIQTSEKAKVASYMSATASHIARVKNSTRVDRATAPHSDNLYIVQTPQFKQAKLLNPGSESKLFKKTTAFHSQGAGLKKGSPCTNQQNSDLAMANVFNSDNMTSAVTKETVSTRSKSTLMAATVASKAKLEQAAELRAFIASQQTKGYTSAHQQNSMKTSSGGTTVTTVTTTMTTKTMSTSAHQTKTSSKFITKSRSTQQILQAKGALSGNAAITKTNPAAVVKTINLNGGSSMVSSGILQQKRTETQFNSAKDQMLDGKDNNKIVTQDSQLSHKSTFFTNNRTKLINNDLPYEEEVSQERQNMIRTDTPVIEKESNTKVDALRQKIAQRIVAESEFSDSLQTICTIEDSQTNLTLQQLQQKSVERTEAIQKIMQSGQNSLKKDQPTSLQSYQPIIAPFKCQTQQDIAISLTKPDNIQTKAIVQEKSEILVNQASNQTRNDLQMTQSYQSQKTFPNIKTLDMKAVLTNQTKEQQSPAEQSHQFSSRQESKASGLNSNSTIASKVNAALNKKVKMRSQSSMSARTTFSTEQKRTQSRQKITSTLQAVKSVSRLQESVRNGRKSKRQQVSANKTAWKELSPPRKKLPEDERQRILQRQQESMKLLMLPTTSSRQKMRKTSQSAERLHSHDSGQNQPSAADQDHQVAYSTQQASSTNSTLLKKNTDKKLIILTSQLEIEPIPELQTGFHTSRNSVIRNNAPQRDRSLTNRSSAKRKTGTSSRQDRVQTTTTFSSQQKTQLANKTKATLTTESSQGAATVIERKKYSRTTVQTPKVKQNGSQSTAIGFQSRKSARASPSPTSNAPSSTISPRRTGFKQEINGDAAPISVYKNDGRKSTRPQQTKAAEEYYNAVVVEEVGAETTGTHVRPLTASILSATSTEKSKSTTTICQKGIPSASEQRAAQRKQKQQMVQLQKEQEGTVPSESTPASKSLKNSIVSSSKLHHNSTNNKLRHTNESMLPKNSNTISRQQIQEVQEVLFDTKPLYNNHTGERLDPEKDVYVKFVQNTSINGGLYTQSEERLTELKSMNEASVMSPKLVSFEAGPFIEGQQQQSVPHMKFATFGSESHASDFVHLSEVGGNTHMQSSNNQSATTFNHGEPCILETQFKEDTKQHLLKCLDQDLTHSKVQRSFRRDFTQIKQVLQQHYYRLNAIFLFYSGQSHSYPAFAAEDFINLAEECGVLSQVCINKSQQTSFEVGKTIIMKLFHECTKESYLQRHEFIELIVRVAAYINKHNNIANQKSKETLNDTLQHLLTNVVLPNTQVVKRYKFRRQIIADVKACELLNKNNEVLEQAYSHFTNSKKKTVNFEECVVFARHCNLDIPDKMLGVIFAESLMTVVDPVTSKIKLTNLTFAEFVYFLCRCIDLHYTNSIYENEEFYIKLDNMLSVLLEPFDLAPQFQLNVNFSPVSAIDLTPPGYQQQQKQQQELFLGNIEFDQPAIRRDTYSTLERMPQTDSSQCPIADTTNDGDIQAWPQPSPIAYPQRVENLGTPISNNQQQMIITYNNQEEQSADAITDYTGAQRGFDKMIFMSNQTVDQNGCCTSNLDYDPTDHPHDLEETKAQVIGNHQQRRPKSGLGSQHPFSTAQKTQIESLKRRRRTYLTTHQKTDMTSPNSIPMTQDGVGDLHLQEEVQQNNYTSATSGLKSPQNGFESHHSSAVKGLRQTSSAEKQELRMTAIHNEFYSQHPVQVQEDVELTTTLDQSQTTKSQAIAADKKEDQSLDISQRYLMSSEVKQRRPRHIRQQSGQF